MTNEIININNSPILSQMRKMNEEMKDIDLNELKKLKHELDVVKEAVEIENEMKSCCMTMDIRAVKFFSQLGISICILGLCISQLVIHYDDCNSNQMYSNILMMLIGVWVPAPNYKKS